MNKSSDHQSINTSCEACEFDSPVVSEQDLKSFLSANAEWNDHRHLGSKNKSVIVFEILQRLWSLPILLPSLPKNMDIIRPSQPNGCRHTGMVEP